MPTTRAKQQTMGMRGVKQARFGSYTKFSGKPPTNREPMTARNWDVAKMR